MVPKVRPIAFASSMPSVFPTMPRMSYSRREVGSKRCVINCSSSDERGGGPASWPERRSEEHTPELQSLMRISYAVFCLKKKKQKNTNTIHREMMNNIHYSQTLRNPIYRNLG